MIEAFADARLHYSPHTTSPSDFSGKVEIPFKYLARKMQIIFAQALRSLTGLYITHLTTPPPSHEPLPDPDTLTLPPQADSPRGGTNNTLTRQPDIAPSREQLERDEQRAGHGQDND